MDRKKHQQQKLQLPIAKSYIESIQQFLTVFKTSPCNLHYEHDLNSCHFHHFNDQRRSPYLEHSFAYYPTLQLLQQALGKLEVPEDMLCRNKAQLLYHPVLYKTQRCSNYYNCGLQIICPHMHAEDQKYFEYGQFFRFDINTHKTKYCPRKDFHERKTCVYYHNQTDRRRPNFDTYSHQLCNQQKCNDQKCNYSHNKIQQVYHPSRYKSKFCKSYNNKNNKCQYKQFCAFAHTQAEIKIQMIHLLNRDHQFFLQKYKTVWCPDTLSHDRSGCVYAHNIQDFRRNPYKYNYQAQKCPYWNFQQQLKSLEDSGCKAGMNCDKCHGWMQQRYHPLTYKKNKQNQIKEANLIIEKKITNIPKQKQIKQKPSRIAAYVDEKVSEIAKNTQNTGIRDVGAPFFKKQANSESSRKTKANNLQSDDSVREQITNVQPALLESNCIAVRKKSIFFLSQDDIWRSNPNQRNDSTQKKLEQQRARSQNKFDDCQTVYSHSLKQAVGDNSVLRKLKDNNINQVRLKNLTKRQIQQLIFLSKPEKDHLNKKIKLYQLRRQKNPIKYNYQLTKFFINKKYQAILQKTMGKKIKQQKLLSLKIKEIQNLDFLTQNQRQQLPKLIQDYKKFRNQQQFTQINYDIERFVSPKRTSQQS